MIAIGSDHAAAGMRAAVADFLRGQGLEFLDCGTNEAPSDYPVVAERVCRLIESGRAQKGILLCGTGLGMCIAANKCKGIRAAVCSETYSAKYARLHNDANVLCMGARVIAPEMALEVLRVFLETEFEGGRHQRRVDMISRLESGETLSGSEKGDLQ